MTINEYYVVQNLDDEHLKSSYNVQNQWKSLMLVHIVILIAFNLQMIK